MSSLSTKSEISFDMIQGSVLLNELMSRHTSWRVGGPVDYWFVPSDKRDLSRFLNILPIEIPIYWMGLGSNLLVRDGGFRGAVICTHGGLSKLEIRQNNEVYAGAGVACAKLARRTARAGLSGAEFMAGIPGTVGGALAMNAGAFGAETWDLVNEVEIVNRCGDVEKRPRIDFSTGYRNVQLRKNEWFLGAVFNLSPSESITTRNQVLEILDVRLEKQPIGSASAGSVFQNPGNDYAARLIESAGFKGQRVGGAMVSSKHANFIINESNASAADIEELIRIIQVEVCKQFQINLQLEVRIVGVK
ncbi:MAG: UDP-N-acetylenolpyruvoylglucosamine reductase [Acidiferrobacteraceae bacterium]|nr:UDP-N-acetylenolpyruvoylglucosamine reductase [Acidiferrobacteraceae bacterium]